MMCYTHATRPNGDVMQYSSIKPLSLVSALDFFPFSIFTKDAQGRYIEANSCGIDAMQTFYKNEAIIGKVNEDFLPAHIAEACTANDKKALASKRIEYFIEKGGGKYWLTAKKAIFFDGEVTGLVGISIPIADFDEHAFISACVSDAGMKAVAPRAAKASCQKDHVDQVLERHGLNLSSDCGISDPHVRSKVSMYMPMLKNMLDESVGDIQKKQQQTQTLNADLLSEVMNKIKSNKP